MRKLRAITLVMVLALACAMPAFAKDLENQVDTGLLPDSSFIYETSIYDLQNSDTYYEGQTVQITGEAVGDIIDAEGESGYKWITVNALPEDKAATVQVVVSDEQAALIDTLGRYEKTGSTVSVTGKFHLVCSQHDGLSDIHATSLSVPQKGSSHHTNFEIAPFVPALGLVFVGLFFFWMYRRKREELQ